MGGFNLDRVNFFLVEKQELVVLDFIALDLIFFINGLSRDGIDILPRHGIAGSLVENPEGNFLVLGGGV